MGLGRLDTEFSAEEEKSRVGSATSSALDVMRCLCLDSPMMNDGVGDAEDARGQ